VIAVTLLSGFLLRNWMDLEMMTKTLGKDDDEQHTDGGSTI
jgi:hypothetical protein